LKKDVASAKYYVIAAFLCNVRNCFYSNQTATYFGCSLENGTKMSLDKYLSLVDDTEDTTMTDAA
jgi:hypothetical protein